MRAEKWWVTGQIVKQALQPPVLTGNKHHLVISQKARLIDDLYLSMEYSGSTEKMQNNALKNVKFLFPHEMGYGEIRMCLEGSVANIGAPILYNILSLAKTCQAKLKDNSKQFEVVYQTSALLTFAFFMPER